MLTIYNLILVLTSLLLKYSRVESLVSVVVAACIYILHECCLLIQYTYLSKEKQMCFNINPHSVHAVCLCVCVLGQVSWIYCMGG